MNVALTGLKKRSMMRLIIEKQPRIMNIAFQPIAGTTVLLNTTPMTAERPKPEKKRAFTLTPSLKNREKVR